MKKSTAEALQSPPGIHINQNAVAPAANKTSTNKNDNGNNEVCLTPGCIHTGTLHAFSVTKIIFIHLIKHV